MITKSVATRKANQLAGARIPLPGHDRLRDARLRAEVAAYWKPQGVVETVWVNDIANCLAVIEVMQALKRGFMLRALRQSLQSQQNHQPWPLVGEAQETSICSADELETISQLGEDNFIACDHTSLLDQSCFAMLLGQMPPSDVAHLRRLDEIIHVQSRERDRLINQLDRRRRQASRDTIEWAEAKVRAEAAAIKARGRRQGKLTSDQGTGKADDTERCSDLPL